MMGAGHYYNILKKAYKRLVMLWHSDKNINQQSLTYEEAEAAAELEEEQYDEVLSSPKKSLVYEYRKTEYRQRQGPFPIVVAEFQLQCTLEQLYNGCTRRVKVKKAVTDAYIRWRYVGEEIFIVDIMPGSHKGEKITFPFKLKRTGYAYRDTIFVLDEKPHDIFMRDGNNLVLNHKILLEDCLAGITIHLTTLDGRSLRIKVTEIVTPGYVKVVRNEGMPIGSEPGKKGDLYIKFDIVFPTSNLTMEVKEGVKKLLDGTFD